jgi:hypothetical protein
MNAPQVITETIELRLENWSRWARTRKVYPGSCRSLESRYRSPQWWEPRDLHVSPDINDALAIEKGLIRMPERNRNILVYAYLKKGYDFDLFCSKHKIRGSREVTKSQQFEIDQRTSENMLRNIVDRHAK